MKKRRKLPETDEQFEKYLKSFVIATLRRGSLYWPFRSEALKAARVDRGLYQCNICKKAFSRKEVTLDHIHSVVSLSGFTNWDDYLRRMFPKAESFQVLCRPDHDAKTKEESMLRKLKKKVDKAIK